MKTNSGKKWAAIVVLFAGVALMLVAAVSASSPALTQVGGLIATIAFIAFVVCSVRYRTKVSEKL
jgi:hypothetical protein